MRRVRGASGAVLARGPGFPPDLSPRAPPWPPVSTPWVPKHPVSLFECRFSGRKSPFPGPARPAIQPVNGARPRSPGARSRRRGACAPTQLLHAALSASLLTRGLVSGPQHGVLRLALAAAPRSLPAPAIDGGARCAAAETPTGKHQLRFAVREIPGEKSRRSVAPPVGSGGWTGRRRGAGGDARTLGRQSPPAPPGCVGEPRDRSAPGPMAEVATLDPEFMLQRRSYQGILRPYQAE